MKPVRLLLIDDHELLRAGMRALLERIPGVAVIGEAGDGRAGMELIRATKPDISLLDITMPGLNGLEALERIRKEFPAAKVIILSMHANEEYVIKAMRSGAASYLLKNSPPEDLELALEAVRAGETYRGPGVARHVSESVPRRGHATAPLAHLTPRARELLP